MSPSKIGIAVLMFAAVAQAQVDSPLVSAAKRAVAARQKSGMPKWPLITNETVATATGKLSTASGGAQVPDFNMPLPSLQTAAKDPAPRSAPSKLDGYEQRAASDPRLPQVSQNSASVAESQNQTGITPPPAQNSTQRPQQSASDATQRTTPTAAPGAPRESQNSVNRNPM